MSKRVNEVSKVLQKYAVSTDLESVKQLKPRNSVSISANITVVGKVLGLTEKTYFRVSQRAEFEDEIKELFRVSPGGKYHKSYDPTSTRGKNQIRNELYSLGISILEGGGASIADSLFPVNGLELYFVIYTQQEADEIREKKKRANPGSGGATRYRKKFTTASPALAPVQPTTPALPTCHQEVQDLGAWSSEFGWSSEPGWEQALEEVLDVVAWSSEPGWAAVTADQDNISWALEDLDADFFFASDDGPAGGPAGGADPGVEGPAAVPPDFDGLFSEAVPIWSPSPS